MSANLINKKNFYQKAFKGTKCVWQADDKMRFVRLDTPQAIAFEEEYMEHTLDKKWGCREKTVTIYSLRDLSGIPYATLGVVDEKKVVFYEGKGRQGYYNLPGSFTIPYVQQFIKQQGFDVLYGQEKIGLIFQIEEKQGKYYNLWDLPDGLVLHADLNLHGMHLTQLPDLSKVTLCGSFDCSGNSLTDLTGAPRSVTGNFNCSDNHLTSLKGAPEKVGGSFDCSNNRLSDLNGTPRFVGCSFNCSSNELKSLQGFPEMPENFGGDIDCSSNMLTNFEGLPQLEKVHAFDCAHNQLVSLQGAPQFIGGSFNCRDNNLKSLEGAPRFVQMTFNCSCNELTDLVGGPEYVCELVCNFNRLSSLNGRPLKYVNIDCYNNPTLKDLPSEDTEFFRIHTGIPSRARRAMLLRKYRRQRQRS